MSTYLNIIHGHLRKKILKLLLSNILINLTLISRSQKPIRPYRQYSQYKMGGSYQNLALRVQTNLLFLYVLDSYIYDLNLKYI